MLSGGLDTRGITAAPLLPGTPDAAADRVARAGPVEPEPQPPIDWRAIVGLGVLGAAFALWVRSLSSIDPTAMSELGLVSVVPTIFFVALALVTVGFVLLVSDPTTPRPLLGGYVAWLAVVAHATPVLVSGTLGNPWAWANVATVDAVQRTGELPVSTELAAPTDWPAVHGFTALVAEATGLDAAEIAMWMPLGFNLFALVALWLLFGSFVTDERITWSALWLFVVGNWVGQDHLSAIGFSMVLALALFAVALPLDRSTERDPVIVADLGPSGTTVRSLAATVAFIGVVALALVTSHQLTPFVVAVTFALAAATRASRTTWLAIGIGLAAALWLVGPARSYVSADPLALIEPLGSPSQFALTTTRSVSDLTSGAQTVLIGGRFIVQVLVVLALVGLIARCAARRRIAFLAGAIALPAVIVLVDRGSESVLRAFLYALAWLVLAAAFALDAVARRAGPAIGLALQLVVFGGLTAAFVVVQSGERDDGHFTAGEVELAVLVADTAPGPALLIEGTANSPGVVGDVERLARAPLSDGSEEQLALVAADPAGELHERALVADADGFEATYVMITRSQQHGEAIAPRLPDGLLPAIDRALRGSDLFVVVAENPDAVLFAAVGVAP